MDGNKRRVHGAIAEVEPMQTRKQDDGLRSVEDDVGKMADYSKNGQDWL